VAIENATKPVVSAIHGTALGGGLEVALTCHFRVAIASARFGLPEVNLGLLPGAGGTQRLPRVVGVEKALHMMTSGEQIGTKEALECGLIDEIVDDLKAGGLAFAARMADEGVALARIRDRDEKVAPFRDKPEVFADFRKANARKFRGFEAPEANIKCIEAAVNLPFDEGIKEEGRLFGGLMSGTQSAAQRYFFFAERQANKIPDVPKDTPKREIKSAAIIGAGTMGGGIAMNFANAGIPVTVVEVKQDALDRGLGVVRRNYENSAKKGRFSMDEVERRMGLITGSLTREDCADADIVIEAVFENMDLKKEIFGDLDRICKQGAILASNTSALDVNEIAASTSRPEDVIGLHFFSPANVMKLLEVVRGDKTANDVIATSMALAKTIGKVPALVGVCNGFVGNRILAMRGVQAQKLMSEGTPPDAVDKVLFDFGFPMGPFQMSDMAGLDIGWNPEKSNGGSIRDVLCEAGRRGLKVGKGYYDYDEGSRVPKPSAEANELIQGFLASQGIEAKSYSDDEILARLLYPMVNEAAKILEEGIAIRASDIDVIWVYGYGWPRYQGGPCFWADLVGLDKIVAKLEEWEAAEGSFWTPSPLLKKLAAEGKGFNG
ncbi:MAG: 3-hydroxyacyl-CoA dehydrogenase NAD-binding domain-containing protein, partial [Alphaproteobacteria bacterium]